jgi:hypothetical protein
VLQQRLKQPGMRWNKDSCQYILSLMAKYKSNLWNKSVVELIRSIYGVEGADKYFGYRKLSN